MLRPTLAGLALTCLCVSGFATQDKSPQSAVDELLAADRAFSAASARTDVITGLLPMFSDDVVMGPIPGNKFAVGKEEAKAALGTNPDNATSSVEWQPIRGGVSADGLHGFTFGYMTLHKQDKSTVGVKYLSYWIRTSAGWRVAVYKRGRRPEGEVATTLLAAALPPRMIPASNDASALEGFRKSLDLAERTFSDEAQKIGLVQAFVKFGTPDAVNMGGPASPGWVVGSEAIGQNLVPPGQQPPVGSPVSWAPDRVIVAGSGDLGVTIGTIKSNAGEGSFPFFTIWRRATTSAPWRYVAE